MKKILFLLSIVLFSSCTCVLSQIPPQYIYVGENCEAVLPDYLTKVTATDNCSLASLIQIPQAGTVLTASQTVTDVEVRATDSQGNHTSINFNVILIDTIPPVITVDTTLTADDSLYGSGYDIIDALYTQADKIIADKLTFFDENFPYEKLGLPVQDSTYFKEYLIVSTSPGYAITKQGGRVWSFWNPNDSIR
jgi:hypothetical protein